LKLTGAAHFGGGTLENRETFLRRFFLVMGYTIAT